MFAFLSWHRNVRPTETTQRGQQKRKKTPVRRLLMTVAHQRIPEGSSGSDTMNMTEMEELDENVQTATLAERRQRKHEGVTGKRSTGRKVESEAQKKKEEKATKSGRAPLWKSYRRYSTSMIGNGRFTEVTELIG